MNYFSEMTDIFDAVRTGTFKTYEMVQGHNGIIFKVRREYCDLYERTSDAVFNIKKIIFNNPCVILIDDVGKKTIVRIQENEQYDMEFGYYMVLAKYLSTNATYSELLGHIYDNSFEYDEQRLNVLTSFLMGKLGVNLCREIAFERVVNILELIHENPKNYTINFKEVLNV